MENHISLRPIPTVASYLKNFQLAQLNFDLFIKEEENARRKVRQRSVKKQVS